MCLIIDHKYPKPDESQQVIRYKVLEKRVSSFYSYYQTTFRWDENEWNEANIDDINETNLDMYRATGFHVFINKKDAEKFMEDKPGNIRVVQLEVRGFICGGTDFKATTETWKQAKFLKVL